MNKKIKSTSEEYIESLSPNKLKKFKEGYREFLLSELILALMEEDEISVRQLAKLAELSPSVIQAMKSGSKQDFTVKSFFKILNGLGCKQVMVEFNGEFIPLNISQNIKK